MQKEQVLHAQSPKPAGRTRIWIKRLLSLVLAAAVLGGGGYGVVRLLAQGAHAQPPQTEFAARGTLQNQLTGSGVTLAKDSASIAVLAASRVLEVNVKEGDRVEQGAPLYTLDDTEAKKTALEAQKAVDGLQKQLTTLRNAAQDLVLTAPFHGILVDTAKLAPGDSVGAGTKIATLADSTMMSLTLYFSYAYEQNIAVGQQAQVSVPDTLSQLSGTVIEVHKVRRPVPEGAVLFEAVISVPNPGALADGAVASATLTGLDNEPIYPYASGTLAYSRTASLVTKTAGEVEQVKLRDYEAVAQGDTLLKLSPQSNDDQITALENQLRSAQETLEKAQAALSAYHPVAPMGGTVLSCALSIGETAEAGKVAVTIADTSVMVVEAQIDERNVSNVTPGMVCQITQNGMSGPQEFTGIVKSVSLTGKSENGVSFFPAQIQVENGNSLLMSGMSVEYKLILAQSEDCVLVPVQAVQYTEQGACVFIRADTAPAEVLDLGGQVEIPAGFFAVPVVTGLSDNTNVEIKTGVDEGAEVYVPSAAGEDESEAGGFSVMEPGV